MTTHKVEPTNTSIRLIVHGRNIRPPIQCVHKLIMFQNQENHAAAFLAIEHSAISQQQIQEEKGQRGRSGGARGKKPQSRARARHKCCRCCVRQWRCCRDTSHSKVWLSSLLFHHDSLSHRPCRSSTVVNLLDSPVGVHAGFMDPDRREAESHPTNEREISRDLYRVPDSPNPQILPPQVISFAFV